MVTAIDTSAAGAAEWWGMRMERACMYTIIVTLISKTRDPISKMHRIVYLCINW